MARFFVNQLLKYTKSLHLMLLEVTMASFNGQVATPRWNTGISETPLPSPPRKFPSFEGGGSQDPPPFYCAPFQTRFVNPLVTQTIKHRKIAR